MKYTNTLKLQKPDLPEKYDIGVHNSNMDTIDAYITELDVVTKQYIDNVINNKIKSITNSRIDDLFK